MYLIVETVRQEAEGDKAEWKSMRQTFRAELGEEPTLVQEGWMEVPRADGEVGEVGVDSGSLLLLNLGAGEGREQRSCMG